MVCSDNVQHCPSLRLRQKTLISASITKRKEAGTYAEERVRATNTRRVEGTDGMTTTKRAADRMSATRRANGSFDTGAIKAANTKATTLVSSGLTLAEVSARKAAKTKTTPDPNGRTIQAALVEKGLVTRHTPDEKGVTSYDRGQIKAKRLKSYPNTSLWYGSSYEKKWIDEQISKEGLIWVSENIVRGPNIFYTDTRSGRKRCYPSDFRIGNTIVEIKSCWIFNKDVEGNCQKLDAAAKKGFEVKIVLDYNTYDWTTQRDEILNYLIRKSK